MAKRLFGIYALVEMAVIIALVATIGFGWTVLLLLASFVVGLVLAGSQLNRHLRRLRSGLSATSAQGAVTDSLLVALGTVLVVIPGLASSVLGVLLLLPPTRAAARPVLTAMAAKRIPIITASAPGFVWAAEAGTPRGRRGDYIDGEIIEGEIIDVPAREDHQGTEPELHRLPPTA
ncbi:FxsA family protein [Mycobacterium sp. 141]|uniref:FxsA family protein n=1 Tax=Mycobacterium sp. 141 TaxID=1120797 RepID=UPI0003713647|nr:FxsA family protein [Mycobacterium sp. 141]